MKNAIKYVAAFAALLLAFGCTKDYPQLSQANLPNASDLTPVITIDQETNYVTFSINEKGVVPMWIFGDEKVDGKASKNYSYTGNGVTLRIRDAGSHTIQLRAYNANGVSQGQKAVTFNMDNTYRDPFDPSPYMKVMANVWEWNSTVKGHFGCGEPGSDGLNWWSCDAGGKEGFSLYDDRLTFTEDGKYTYDPGDGLVYVNWGSGFNPAGHEAEIASETDYATEIDGYTCPYYIEQEWNDAGVEELYLVLPEGKNLSYIPNPEALKEPRWRFVSTKVADIKKCLDLIIDNGNIAWRYQFVPEGSVGPDPGPDPVDDEADYDITGPTNLWRSATIATEYWYSPGDWSGGIDADATIGEHNDFHAFIPEAVGGSEWMAQNKLKTGISTTPDKLYDFCCTIVSDTDATITIKLTGNPEDENDVHNMFYDGSVKLTAYEPFTYKKANITNQSVGTDDLMLIFDFGRSPGATIDVTDICFQEHREPKGAGTEIWDNDKVSLSWWYSPGDWSGGLTPDISEIAGGWSVVIPEGIGGSEWMGQTHFTLDAPVYADKKYTFKVKLNSTADCTCTVKLAWEGHDNDNAFFYDNNVKLSAYEDFVYIQADIAPNTDYDKVALFIDLGRTPAGETVEITNISLKELPSLGTDIWDNDKVSLSWWYSPGDWSGGLTPDISEIAGGWSVLIPEGIGGSEWMGQTHFTLDAGASASKKYNFQLKLNCTCDCTCTVKLAWEGHDNDNAFFYDNDVKLTAYEDLVYVQADIAPNADYDKIALFVDLGRTPAGETVEITEIHLYEQ